MKDSLNLLKSYGEITELHDLISSKLLQFITKANELVQLSEDDYQIEKTLKLNKISLKGFVLNSPCCIALKNSKIANYSIRELKNYLIQYENTFYEDCSKYHLAISLYELIGEIEKMVDSKIDLETYCLNVFAPDSSSVKSIDKSQYEELYFTVKKQLTDSLNNSIFDEKTYNMCIGMLNDVFNFYIGGYPSIPDEYLYKKDGS